MARIAGVDLPKDKRIEIGLTYVYGIGRTSAKKILDMTGINPDTRVKDLTDEEEAKIRECIDHHFIVEGDLRRSVALDIKRLTEIGCYRGQLIFFTGGLMNTMIPEIEKIAAYVQGDTVTRADILAVAHRMPEAVAYELTDRLADQDYDGAMRILADLLTDKANTPIFLLAVIGQQMRRLYAARLARRAGLGTSDLRVLLGLPFDFIAENLLRSARKFSGWQLEEAVRLCAQTDFAMKSTGADDTELLKELLLRIAVGGAA